MLGSVLFVLVLGLAPAPGGLTSVRLPDLEQLVQAAAGADEVELERLGRRLGASRLERVATRGRPAERLAALRTLGLIPDGWVALPGLASLLADPDPEAARAAAGCLRRIAEGLTPERLELDEIPRDVLARGAAQLLTEATRPTASASVQVATLGAVAALRGLVPVEHRPLERLLTNPDAGVRLAAVEAVAGLPEAEPALADLLSRDPTPAVAAAAAAALCRDVPLSPATPTSTAERRAEGLSLPARERLRALARDESLSLAYRLELLPCMRIAPRSTDPKAPDSRALDRKALDQLARHGPEALRRRARALGGR